MKVKDIMITDVISVKPETKVNEIAKIIFNHNFHGVPVVEDGIVVGMVTENDFLTRDFAKIHIPSLIKIINDLNISKNSAIKKDGLDTILAADARSIMSENFFSVRPETGLTELIKIFSEKQINPIPVVDKDEKLVGIVSKADIINLIGRIREEEIDFLLPNQ